MDDDKKGKSLLAAGLVEITIVTVLIVAILGTLNYFAVLPLSDTFPFLSFLPQQSTQVNPQKRDNQFPQAKIGQNQDQSSNVRRLIVSPDVKTVTNSTIDYKYDSIKDSFIKVTGPVRINIELGFDLTPDAQTASGSGSFMFGSGLGGSKKDLRILSLFYWPPGKTWALQYLYGEKSEFYNLISMPTGKIYGRFSLLISGDGKQVTVILPTFEQKAFNLPDSLYTATNQMNSTIQVAPGQTITVSDLNYQY